MLANQLASYLEFLSSVKSRYPFKDRNDYRITSHAEKAPAFLLKCLEIPKEQINTQGLKGKFIYTGDTACTLLYTLIFMGVVFGEVKYFFEAGRLQMYFFSQEGEVSKF